MQEYHHVTILANVTSIGYYAFSGCISLTGVTLPSSVTSIGTSAFEDCGSLTGMKLPIRRDQHRQFGILRLR